MPVVVTKERAPDSESGSLGLNVTGTVTEWPALSVNGSLTLPIVKASTHPSNTSPGVVQFSIPWKSPWNRAPTS